MWLTGDRVAEAALLSLLLPLYAAAQGTAIDCARMVADKHTFDLSKLDGPHSVMHSTAQPPSLLNTTYTLNICRPLVPDGGEKQRCPGPTRVCAIERLINPISDTNSIARVIPIAGELTEHSGSALSAQLTRLRTSAAPADADREGLRVELHGGVYAGRAQKAVVELLCDRALTGLEGEIVPQDRYKSDKRDGDAPPPTNATALLWKAYGPEGDADVLRLEWRTKYACESAAEEGEETGGPTTHWGFFTWFIIVAFMGTATYLIFGSWLNYSRYGARGWDLLPHVDALRDVPYLLKDWARRVFATVQQSGERGGYSAV